MSKRIIIRADTPYQARFYNIPVDPQADNDQIAAFIHKFVNFSVGFTPVSFCFEDDEDKNFFLKSAGDEVPYPQYLDMVKERPNSLAAPPARVFVRKNCEGAIPMWENDELLDDSSALS